MTDPMDDLRQIDRPIDPRPEFTADLRARVERELGPIPPGGAMATETRHHTITPYLAVSDARAAMAWYENIFGATVATEPIVMPDGRVGHVELRIGDAIIMMADEFADIDALGPTSRGGTTVSFVISVPDVDTVYARAVAAGATAERPPTDQFYGERAGWLSDPWGHRWSISTPLAAVPGRLAEQDLGTRAEPATTDVANLGYFTIGVHDVEQASTFYSSLFGWRAEGDDGRHVANITPPGGLRGGEEPSITIFFRVADIHATAARVRALGGDASEPELMASGWNASCHDDQGVAFALWQPAPGY